MVALFAWIFFSRMAYRYDCLGKSNYLRWVELTISYLTFIAIVIGGSFAYFKYDNYRRESNYQKVITRYLDNNIDVFTYEMSSYSMKVILNLELGIKN